MTREGIVLSASGRWSRRLGLVVVLAVSGARAAESDVAGRVKEVLDARCVACHACYNAPCQLDLTSWQGLARGATTMRVYDAARLTPARPTRLFVDARTPREWHEERGFFSVLRPLGSEPSALSVLGRMLALKREEPEARVTATPTWMCPRGRAGMAEYARLGRGGMPHGFPALTDEEDALVRGWLDDGAAIPEVPPPPIAPQLRDHLDAWEELLAGAEVRERLVARYLYEHLYLAHLHVEGHPGRFFRLVRSRTRAPEPVDEIATVRPYDDPGVARVHYRFVPVIGTLVHKTHITFSLSPKRLQRYRDWFLGTQWGGRDLALPGYSQEVVGNPFETFNAIPALARYRFFLDNARYFVTSFIRGPVCEGQMAVNVINDHFHVLFIDPASDLSVTAPSYLDAARELLALPTPGEGDPFKVYYLTYKRRQERYTALREERYASAYPRGQGIEALWDGAGEDPDAMLTVFRHFDNAAVVHGARGGVPKTLWVVDYPIFERLYYLLVAGFDVYGTSLHQAATRLYMDNLRVESEDLFLSFLPRHERPVLRDRWYRGLLAELKMEILNPLRGEDRPTAVRYGEGDVKAEFVAQAIDRLGGAVRDYEPLLNVSRSDDASGFDGSRQAVARALNRLTLKPAPFVQAMPDLTYLLVDYGEGGELYAMIRNKAHTNVAFMFEENDRREPEDDSLVILKGVAGSYPNFIVHLEAADVPGFVALLENWSGSAGDREALASRFGVSRRRADFWLHYDALNMRVMRYEGIAGARMDLSKYDLR